MAVSCQLRRVSTGRLSLTILIAVVIVHTAKHLSRGRARHVMWVFNAAAAFLFPLNEALHGAFIVHPIGTALRSGLQVAEHWLTKNPNIWRAGPRYPRESKDIGRHGQAEACSLSCLLISSSCGSSYRLEYVRGSTTVVGSGAVKHDTFITLLDVLSPWRNVYPDTPRRAYNTVGEYDGG